MNKETEIELTDNLISYENELNKSFDNELYILVFIFSNGSEIESESISSKSIVSEFTSLKFLNEFKSRYLINFCN